MFFKKGLIFFKLSLTFFKRTKIRNSRTYFLKKTDKISVVDAY